MGWVGVWDRERLIGISQPEGLRKERGLVGSMMKEGRKGLVTLYIFRTEEKGKERKDAYFLESVITKCKAWNKAALHRNWGKGRTGKAWELAAFA
jgi:hypothetical protein